MALSPVFIPVGISKCFPAQHMVNVLGAVMLGPAYAVAIATIAGIIRNILGLGTLLAFPGGMIGALLGGLSYRISKNIYLAGLGEVIGTGILGSLASVWIVAPLLMGKTMAVATLMIAFSVKHPLGERSSASLRCTFCVRGESGSRDPIARHLISQSAHRHGVE